MLQNFLLTSQSNLLMKKFQNIKEKETPKSIKTINLTLQILFVCNRKYLKVNQCFPIIERIHSPETLADILLYQDKVSPTTGERHNRNFQYSFEIEESPNNEIPDNNFHQKIISLSKPEPSTSNMSSQFFQESHNFTTSSRPSIKDISLTIP